jgi:exodeoxyribonuclease VII small subunit
MAAEKKISYEQARDELAEIVESLESGSATLEESLALWERGEALSNRCEKWLSGARDQLEKVSKAKKTGAE